MVTEGLAGRGGRTWLGTHTEDVVSQRPCVPWRRFDWSSSCSACSRLVPTRELTVSDLAGDADVGRDTVSNYVALLQALHLVTLLPPWSSNVTSRAKHRPKVVLVDTGLAADLCGVAPDAGGQVAGALFETFVIDEVLKQATWSERSVDLWHFLDRNGAEVDLIVEDRRTGEVSAVEVKLSGTPTARHARHLVMLRDRLGARFRTGLVVHAGAYTLPLGDRIWVVPVSALWRSDA
jgi:uncharacterized protein